MLNHLITSYRFLRKSKTYTMINLSGLVLGLSAAFILLIAAINQLTFDHAIPESIRTYRLLSTDKKKQFTEVIAPIALAELCKDKIRSIEKAGIAIRFSNFWRIATVSKSVVFTAEPDIICANTDLLDILAVQIIAGDPRAILSDSSKIILSEKTARKYFGSGDAVGKKLRLKTNGIVYPLTVEAVYRNFPWNSTFTADIIGSLALFRKILKDNEYSDKDVMTSLTNGYADIYVRTKQETNYRDLLRQTVALNSMPEIRKQHITYSFQNIRDIYFHSDQIQNDAVRKGKKQDLYIYVSLALFILFLAGVNYSILSTARSALRFKEIGVRKVMGATRSDLRSQILTESVLLTFIAFPLSMILLGLILPLIEPYFGQEIRMYTANLPYYLVVFSGITLVIGFFSGAYVAFFLASMNPMDALKSKFFSYKKFSLSKLFIIFQLFVTLVLMIGLINVYRQINYCLSQNDTSDKENLLLINFNQSEFKKYEELKKAVRIHPEVLSLTGSSLSPPSTAAVLRKMKLPGAVTQDVEFEIASVDYDFFKTLNIPMVKGKELSRREKQEGIRVTYINEQAEKAIRLKQPIGGSIGKFKIKGVSRDFNLHTLHSRIPPSLLLLNPEGCQTLILRYNYVNQDKVLTLARTAWQNLAPDQQFQYTFYDRQLSDIYKSERNFARVVGSFTILAFLITGMGLFGLAMLLSERRMKEMSIRKIFGASNPDIIFQMQKEFFIYIGIAALIAIPFSWYMMSLWLSEFYYRVTLHWFTFAISVLTIAGFVSMILLYRTMRLIRENPINALKYE